MHQLFIHVKIGQCNEVLHNYSKRFFTCLACYIVNVICIIH